MTNLTQVCSMNPQQAKQFVLDCQSCKTCVFEQTCDKLHNDEERCHDGITQWLATNNRG